MSTPAPTITLLPRRAPVGHSAPIRGTSLAVLPLNDKGQQIVAALGVVGADTSAVFPATLEPEGQAGIAVLSLTESQALAVGRSLRLGAIFFWDGRRGSALACADP